MSRRVCVSGCYGEHLAYFEPLHGAAPDIAGTRTINPTSTLLLAAMIREHLDLADAAKRCCEAVIDRLRSRGEARPRCGRAP